MKINLSGRNFELSNISWPFLVWLICMKVTIYDVLNLKGYLTFVGIVTTTSFVRAEPADEAADSGRRDPRESVS